MHIQELRYGRDFKGKCAAMSQFLLIYNTSYGNGMVPVNTMTTEDLAAFEAISRSKNEPAQNRALALVCRALMSENMTWQQAKSLRIFTKAAQAIEHARKKLHASELAEPVVALTGGQGGAESAGVYKTTVSQLLRTMAGFVESSIKTKEESLIEDPEWSDTQRQQAHDKFGPAFGSLIESIDPRNPLGRQDVTDAAGRQPGMQCDCCGSKGGAQRLLKCASCGWVWYCSSGCQKKGAPLFLAGGRRCTAQP